jgi:hypothetical protein
MESSTVLAFRIFVMLSCLIIVPMAAIFGSAFPEVVKSVLVDRIVSLGGGKPESAASRDDAPSSGPPQAPGGSSALAPGFSGATVEAPAWQGALGDPTAPVVVAGAPSVYPPSANQSASFSEPAGPARLPPAPPTSPMGTATGPAASVPGAEAAGRSVVHASGSAWQQPEDFAGMERKLRQHGAVYYLLETWGNEGELYRFHCRMAIANNPNYTRHFEATDRDALKAMAQVLSRVEAWRGGRIQ